MGMLIGSKIYRRLRSYVLTCSWSASTFALSNVNSQWKHRRAVTWLVFMMCTGRTSLWWGTEQRHGPRRIAKHPELSGPLPQFGDNIHEDRRGRNGRICSRESNDGAETHDLHTCLATFTTTDWQITRDCELQLFSSSICSEIERSCLVYNLNVPIKSKRSALVRCSNGKRGGFCCYATYK